MAPLPMLHQSDTPPIPSAPEGLLHLQWLQFQHDKKYYWDVLALSVHDRMKHMTLHFAKYVGALAENEQIGDEARTTVVLVDAFIIALSSANALNINLESAVEAQKISFDQLAMKWFSENDFCNIKSNIGLAMAMARWTGRMGKACESLDHLERGDFIALLSAALINLFKVIIVAAMTRGIDLPKQREVRLSAVSEKKIFQPYFQ